MSKMKELYSKVAADSALQEKYYKVVEEAGGEAALGEKLIAFAREQGFDVTLSDGNGLEHPESLLWSTAACFRRTCVIHAVL